MSYNILGFKIKRREIAKNYIKHYTTKVCEIKDDSVIFNGFSPTDMKYIYGFAYEKGINVDVYLRIPKLSSCANPIILVEHDNNFILPEMSADICLFDDGAKKFHLKPLLRRLGN